MNVATLPMFAPQVLSSGAERQETNKGLSFGEMLNNALMEVNRIQIKADDTTRKFLIGEIQDIHQVTIAAEQARLMLQLAVEVRNKVVEAYQEISRTQV